ncbi:MAG: hypothetical protein J4215_05370 [Candidatus Diapherotrites archaeon]|uniref:SprT-like domain-containing protein n=1 Tax=Candidatus Iainarchaeum sp. TaxID=3101447 RepID=A0A8T4L614_9ARCH|nr:hypothetical protein [Candidatus Diapherotrites archaeon]
MTSPHSDQLLARRCAQICREYFKGKEITNLLVVRWGKPWKTKLGHIKPLRGNVQYGSIIEINTVFQDPRVPQFVVDVTMLHELIHYFQGFGSNHPRKHRHPHRGGSVTNEFREFGWVELLKKQNKWIKENWVKMWKEHHAQYKLSRIKA